MSKGTIDARVGASMIAVLEYELLQDGRVELSGPRSKGLINTLLPDGSRVQGGITATGELFGNRVTAQGTAHDLMWKPTNAPTRGYQDFHRDFHQEPVPVPAEARVPEAAYRELQNEHKTLVTEVADLRAQLKQLRASADTRLQEIKQEYARLSRSKRWQVAAVPGTTIELEGLSARTWELEDGAGKLKYLIVVKTAPGTSTKVEAQWMGDLQAKLDEWLGDNTSYYVVLANNMSVVVNELIPGLEEDLQEFDQF